MLSWDRLCERRSSRAKDSVPKPRRGGVPQCGAASRGQATKEKESRAGTSCRPWGVISEEKSMYRCDGGADADYSVQSSRREKK